MSRIHEVALALAVGTIHCSSCPLHGCPDRIGSNPHCYSRGDLTEHFLDRAAEIVDGEQDESGSCKNRQKR